MALIWNRNLIICFLDSISLLDMFVAGIRRHNGIPNRGSVSPPVILVTKNFIIGINYQVTYDFTMIQGAEPGQDPLAVLKVLTCEHCLTLFDPCY